MCSSSLHLPLYYGPPSSAASQLSLDISAENKDTECKERNKSVRCAKRRRADYEDLAGIDDDENDRKAAGSKAASKGAQGWRNVRAVMAYYCTLRKIKRNVLS